jgi:hypothetical protein
MIRSVENLDELNEVYQITHDAFVQMGYAQPRADGRLIYFPQMEQLAETRVLVALQGGQMVGTVSWTLDGPLGLHVDEDFRTECDAIRAEGRKLAAAWRVVTRPDVQQSPQVILALIEAVIEAVIEEYMAAGVEVSLFTFNPVHERVYQKLLGMQTVARSEGTCNLENAPAVLMRAEMGTLPERWLRRSRLPMRKQVKLMETQDGRW